MLHEPRIDNVVRGILVNRTMRLGVAVSNVATQRSALSTFQFASINRDQSRRVDYGEMKFT